MITIDDKLDLFRKAVLQKVIDKYDTRLQAHEGENEKELKAFEKNILDKKVAFIEKNGR